jgi:hypothetical protein
MLSLALRAGLVYALCGKPAPAGGEPIKPTIDVHDVRLVLTYVSIGELTNLQHKYGGSYIDQRDVRQSGRHGFSILRTNRDTGAVTCEIYLPKSKQPRDVDDEGTLILGHELLHCLLGNYHR